MGGYSVGRSECKLNLILLASRRRLGVELSLGQTPVGKLYLVGFY